jgi:hypothetical protein
MMPSSHCPCLACAGSAPSSPCPWLVDAIIASAPPPPLYDYPLAITPQSFSSNRSIVFGNLAKADAGVMMISPWLQQCQRDAIVAVLLLPPPPGGKERRKFGFWGQKLWEFC